MSVLLSRVSVVSLKESWTPLGEQFQVQAVDLWPPHAHARGRDSDGFVVHGLHSTITTCLNSKESCWKHTFFGPIPQIPNTDLKLILFNKQFFLETTIIFPLKHSWNHLFYNVLIKCFLRPLLRPLNPFALTASSSVLGNTDTFCSSLQIIWSILVLCFAGKAFTLEHDLSWHTVVLGP